jgi:hypothetical protein
MTTAAPREEPAAPAARTAVSSRAWRNASGLAFASLAAAAVLASGVVSLRASLPATSGPAALAAFAPALAVLAALLLLRAPAEPVLSRLDGLPGPAALARSLGAIGHLALPGFLLGRGLRATALRPIALGALAAALGSVLAARGLPAIGLAWVERIAAVVLLASAVLVASGSAARPALAWTDGILGFAGAAVGVAAALFASRPEVLALGSPAVAAVGASLLASLGAGALTGAGLGRSRPRAALGILVVLLGLAVAFDLLLLEAATGRALDTALHRFGRGAPEVLLLGAAFSFAPIAATWGLATGALLVVGSRERGSAAPSVSALALGFAAALLAAGGAAGRDDAERERERDALELPRAIHRAAGAPPGAEVVVAAVEDLEALRRGSGRLSLVIALPSIGPDALALESVRAAARRVGADALYCQWLRVSDVAPGEAGLEGVLRAFHLAFPHGGVWLSAFADAKPRLLLVGASRRLTLDAGAPGAAGLDAGSVAGRFLASAEDLEGALRASAPATLERDTLRWRAGVVASAAGRHAPEILRFFAERRADLSTLVDVDRAAVGDRQAMRESLGRLAAASRALLWADVARMRAQTEIVARLNASEAAVRRDLQWDAYADAYEALPGDGEIERIVCAEAATLDPAERRLRLDRFVRETGLRGGPIARLLAETEVTERR